MPVFIDESGSVGTLVGSQTYFRLCAVWVPLSEANSLREAIRKLRKNLRLNDDFEFKYSDLAHHADRREAFLRTALRYRFQFAVIAIDKTHPPWSKATRSELHYTTSVSLAATLRPVLSQEEARSRRWVCPVVVDDNNDRHFLKTLSDSFRLLRSDVSDRSLTQKAAFQDSRHDDLLQLADMICGAAGEHIDFHHFGGSQMYRLIRWNGIGLDIGYGRGLTSF